MNQNQSTTGKSTIEKHGLILPSSDQSLDMENRLAELKSRCIESVLQALDNYHHAGMGTQELKTIVKNVIENRVEIPA